MLSTLILGIIFENVGLIGFLLTLGNYGNKLNFLWQIPLFLIGIVLIYSSLRMTTFV